MKVKPASLRGEVILEVNERDEKLLRAASAGRVRIKNILVPIDFSDCSRKAIRYALPLAEEHDATITLLYVVSVPYTSGEYGVIDVAGLINDMRAAGEKQLTALAKEEIADKAEVRYVVAAGSPTGEIVTLARTLPADLIAVSTHGHTGLKHVLLGSVAEHIVRYAPCPVLVVREVEREFVSK